MKIAQVVKAKDAEYDSVMCWDNARGFYLQRIDRVIFGDDYARDGLYFHVVPDSGTFAWDGPDIECGPDDPVVVFR